MQSMFSDHKVIKLEISNRKIPAKMPKYLEIKQHIFKYHTDHRRSLKKK